MRILGDDIHIQKGENWTLDFNVVNKDGDPFTLLNVYKNPYLVITVAQTLYEKERDFRRTYWLDLSKIYELKADGSPQRKDFKTFASTELFYVKSFSNASQDLKTYCEKGIMSHVATAANCVDKFLFYTINDYGHREYKYLTQYNYNNIDFVNLEWANYEFRIVKQFDTRDWPEQAYYFDIKIIAGSTLYEAIYNYIDSAQPQLGKTLLPIEQWTTELALEYANMIVNEETKVTFIKLINDGVPLHPSYDIKLLISAPTRLYVSANLQGGK